MLVVVVFNLKGGTAKTTTAAFVAHAFAELDLSVLVTDADPQGSCLRWSETAGWKVPVVGLPVRNIHAQLPGIVGDRYDVVVVDTPPLEDHKGIVISALRIPGPLYGLTPMAPTPIEYERMPAVRAAVADANDLRADPINHTVLLTRTVPNAASTDTYRGLLTEDGVRVLRPAVGRRERYAQAYGDPIEGATNTAYGDAVAELLEVA